MIKYELRRYDNYRYVVNTERRDRYCYRTAEHFADDICLMLRRQRVKYTKRFETRVENMVVQIDGSFINATRTVVWLIIEGIPS